MLDAHFGEHHFEMSIVGCEDIEDVGEVGGVADEF